MKDSLQKETWKLELIQKISREFIRNVVLFTAGILVMSVVLSVFDDKAPFTFILIIGAAVDAIFVFAALIAMKIIQSA